MLFRRKQDKFLCVLKNSVPHITKIVIFIIANIIKMYEFLPVDWIFFVKTSIFCLFNKLYARMYSVIILYFVTSQTAKYMFGINFNKQIRKMKKTIILCAGLCVALSFASCGSSESAYKKAYEKAMAQQGQQGVQREETAVPVVTPLEQKPATQTTVQDNVDNATFRTENVDVISGKGLSLYSVVVGSFSLKANAEGLQRQLISNGYEAQIAYNSQLNMYRVVASTFADKASAVRSRNQLRQTYSDSWLLYKK